MPSNGIVPKSQRRLIVVRFYNQQVELDNSIYLATDVSYSGMSCDQKRNRVRLKGRYWFAIFISQIQAKFKKSQVNVMTCDYLATIVQHLYHS